MSGKGIDWAAVRTRLAESRRAVERTIVVDGDGLSEVYRRRAQRLAERQLSRREVPMVHVLAFWLGTERCAVELTEVAEVLPFRQFTPVPGTPGELLGVVNLRGSIRPVLDMAGLLGIPGSGAREGGYALFLRWQGGETGVRVDVVDAVRSIAVEDLVRPGEDDGGALTTRFARGIAPGGLVLLDGGALRGALARVLGNE